MSTNTIHVGPIPGGQSAVPIRVACPRLALLPLLTLGLRLEGLDGSST